MKKLIFCSVIICVILSYGCSKTSDEELGKPCDTTNMKYSTDVVPILEVHCYACHGTNTNSGSEGRILQGYSKLKPYATDGTLIGAITHAAGFPQMPKDGPKLNDCQINTIRSWINNGAQEN